MTQAKLKELFDYRKDGHLIRKLRNRTKRPLGWINQKPKQYRFAQVNNKLCLVHRLIFCWHHGFYPTQVDHINGKSTDNRIENLRAATPSENLFNRGAPKNSRTKIKGVYFCNTSQKYVAQISAFRKRKTLGQFDTLKAAQRAYEKAAQRLHGEFAVKQQRGTLST